VDPNSGTHAITDEVIEINMTSYSCRRDTSDSIDINRHAVNFLPNYGHYVGNEAKELTGSIMNKQYRYFTRGHRHMTAAASIAIAELVCGGVSPLAFGGWISPKVQNPKSSHTRVADIPSKEDQLSSTVRDMMADANRYAEKKDLNRAIQIADRAAEIAAASPRLQQSQSDCSSEEIERVTTKYRSLRDAAALQAISAEERPSFLKRLTRRNLTKKRYHQVENSKEKDKNSEEPSAQDQTLSAKPAESEVTKAASAKRSSSHATPREENSERRIAHSKENNKDAETPSAQDPKISASASTLKVIKAAFSKRSVSQEFPDENLTKKRDGQVENSKDKGKNSEEPSAQDEELSAKPAESEITKAAFSKRSVSQEFPDKEFPVHPVGQVKHRLKPAASLPSDIPTGATGDSFSGCSGLPQSATPSITPETASDDWTKSSEETPQETSLKSPLVRLRGNRSMPNHVRSALLQERSPNASTWTAQGVSSSKMLWQTRSEQDSAFAALLPVNRFQETISERSGVNGRPDLRDSGNCNSRESRSPSAGHRLVAATTVQETSCQSLKFRSSVPPRSDSSHGVLLASDSTSARSATFNESSGGSLSGSLDQFDSSPGPARITRPLFSSAENSKRSKTKSSSDISLQSFETIKPVATGLRLSLSTTTFLFATIGSGLVGLGLTLIYMAKRSKHI
jgi:outer membrane murein-binding lipoprotein Lpp